MKQRMMGATLAAAGLIAMTPAEAAKSNCGPNGPPCGTSGPAKDVAIMPGPDDFALRGDLFTDSFTDLLLTNGSARVDLGFNVNFGSGLVSSLFVNRNGIVSFGAALSPSVVPNVGATGVTLSTAALTVSGGDTRLSDLGVPVIAPYFAALQQGAGAGNGTLEFGDITVQYGKADPYADGGAYKLSDARDAVRITWYGLDASRAAVSALGTASATASLPVFAQLLISADDAGLSNFEFRYGPPGTGRAFQPDYGSIAGFALGNTELQFRGPYLQGVPTFFEFLDGQYIGQGGMRIDAAVPEPTTWAQLILGFGLLGYTLRRRQSRTVLAA